MSFLRRVSGLVINACRRFRKKSFLRGKELSQAVELHLFKAEQKISLSKKIDHLTKPSSPRPQLVHPLKLFLDSHGLVRCGGCLDKSTLPYISRYPILLTKKSPLLTLRIREAHTKLLHAGAEQTKAKIRESLWIPQLTTVAKQVIRDCFNCKKATDPPF
jgi:hypothetical protein